MDEAAKQVVLPGLAGALEILKRQDRRPFRMASFRPVLGGFQVVPADDAQESVVNTIQKHESEGRITTVYTEFRSIVRIQDVPGGGGRIADAPRADAAAQLAFGIVISYEFHEDESEIDRAVLAKINAVMHAWPYWRVFTFNALSQLGIQATVTPLLQPEQAAQMAGFREEEGDGAREGNAQSSKQRSSNPEGMG